jgi:hypothetical protein
MQMLEHSPSNAQPQCLEHCKSSNPRTYARTHKEPLRLDLSSNVSNAHTRVARFIPVDGRTAPTAAAARSPEVSDDGR